MRVLLISLQSNIETIGLRYLHSYLSSNNINSKLLYLPNYKQKNYEIVAQYIKQFAPNVIAISLMSNEFLKVKKLSSKIKKSFSDIKVVWGGLYPTINYKACINHCDYVFIGESEVSFLEFIKAIEKKKVIDDIPNMVTKKDGKIIKNNSRFNFHDMDSFPFPKHLPANSYILENKKIVTLEKKHIKKYMRYGGRIYNLITSKGCPLSCSFCNNSFSKEIIGPKKFRTRSPENVIQELYLEIKEHPDILYVTIHDDSFFSHSIDWIKKFSKLYKEKIKLNFYCLITPSTMNEQKLALLVDAGLTGVEIGIQTGSERINYKIYNRPISNKLLIKCAKLLRKYNLFVLYDILVDNPYEKEKDVLKTIELLVKLPKPHLLNIYSLWIYEGTLLYKKAIKDGIKLNQITEKEYRLYKKKYLTKIIRLCPLLPKKVIKHFVKNRNIKFYQNYINFIFYPSILFIESFIGLKIIIRYFNYDLIKVTKLILSLPYRIIERLKLGS